MFAGAAPEGSQQSLQPKLFLWPAFAQRIPCPCGSSGAWEASALPALPPDGGSEAALHPHPPPGLQHLHPPLPRDGAGGLGSPGRGPAQLPKGHNQGCKPVSDHLRGQASAAQLFPQRVKAAPYPPTPRAHPLPPRGQLALGGLWPLAQQVLAQNLVTGIRNTWKGREGLTVTLERGC